MVCAATGFTTAAAAAANPNAKADLRLSLSITPSAVAFRKPPNVSLILPWGFVHSHKMKRSKACTEIPAAPGPDGYEEGTTAEARPMRLACQDDPVLSESNTPSLCPRS